MDQMHRKQRVSKMGISKSTCFILLSLLAAVAQPGWADDELTSGQAKFFESKIRPVLVRECYGCHSNQVGQIKGGLWLDDRDGMRTGGDSGAAVVPGNLADSLLWNAINHEDYRMPPGKKLSREILADFREWIETGAPDPRTPETTKIKTSITEEDIRVGRRFWAFTTPELTAVPDLGSDWARTEIDRFVLAKLQATDLQPNPDTDRQTVLRRLTFDLIGLPPTPEQMQRWESSWQEDPNSALEQMIDSLLAKPEFGERWGRHWLDVARYAESTGKEQNLTYPHAWRYRDYVIDSFNADKPYDRFVQEQIAGDLLPIKSDEDWAVNLVATGFLAIGPKTLTEQNARQFELDLIDEQLDVTTRVMLGVSVACARCHDHKFDPIPQTDYYALAGIFRSMTTHYGTFDSNQNRRPSNLLILPVEDPNPFDKTISTKQLADWNSQLTEKRQELRELQLQRRQARSNPNATNSAEQRRSVASFNRTSTEVGILESRINAYDEDGNPYSYCMGVQDADQPVNARLLERGEFNKPAQEVSRGFPQVLCDQPTQIESDSSGRLEFARWIGSEANPLTARVMVNRVWLHMMGNGIVRSPENFGATGQALPIPSCSISWPSNLWKTDWSIKQLIRNIALSRIYQSSSAVRSSQIRDGS